MKLKTGLFLFLLIIYSFYFIPSLGVIESRYLDLTHSIVKEKRFCIDSFHYNTIDKSFYKNHYYSMSAPGLAFFTVPFYIIFQSIWSTLPEKFRNIYYNPNVHLEGNKNFLTKDFLLNYSYKEFIFSHIFINFFVVSIVSCLLALLFYKILELFVTEESIILLLVFSLNLGTIIFSFSTRLFPHVICTYLGLLVFYRLLMYKLEQYNKPNYYLFLTGLFAGTIVFIDYYLIILWLCLFFYLLSFKLNIKNIIYYLSGNILPISLLLIYQYICFDNPFRIAYQLSIFHQNIYGKGLLGVSNLKLDIVVKLLFGLNRGYFCYMPILLLSIPGFFIKWKTKININNNMKEYNFYIEKIICIAIGLSFLLFNSSRIYDWTSGSTFGPRYLTPTIPFLMLSIGFLSSRINFNIILLLSLVSIFINWTGAQLGDVESVKESILRIFRFGITSHLQFFNFVNNSYQRIINFIFPIIVFIIILLYIKNTKLLRTKYLLPIVLIFLFICSLLNHVITFATYEKYYLANDLSLSPTLNVSRPVLEIPIQIPIYAKGIRIVSNLAFAQDVLQESKIAEVTVFEENNRVLLKYPILAGIDTSEWAWERSDIKKNIKHKKAKSIIDGYRINFKYIFPKEIFPELSYYTDKIFLEKCRITKILIKYVYSTDKSNPVAININKVLLIR